MHASSHLATLAAGARPAGHRRYVPPGALERRPALGTSALARVRGALRCAAKIALVALMVLASVAVWVGSPLAWLWIASRITDSAHPGLGPYALLFGGVVLTSVVLGRLLAAADRAYLALARVPQPRVHQAWLRASGQQKRERETGGPVVIVMTISVIAAVVCLVAWFVVSGHPFEPIPFLGLR